MDIDAVAAESLVAARPAAIVNAAQSISGRYPNLGPEIIVAAGIPLIDDPGPDVITAPDEGGTIRGHEGEVRAGDPILAKGAEPEPPPVPAALQHARAALAAQI